MFIISLIFFSRGSANNERRPNARGPNSALPDATPTILLWYNSSIIFITGYSPFISCPKNGPGQRI